MVDTQPMFIYLLRDLMGNKVDTFGLWSLFHIWTLHNDHKRDNIYVGGCTRTLSTYLFLFLLTEAHVKDILDHSISFHPNTLITVSGYARLCPTVPMSVLRRLDEMAGGCFKLIMTAFLNPRQDHREDRAPYVAFYCLNPEAVHQILVLSVFGTRQKVQLSAGVWGGLLCTRKERKTKNWCATMILAIASIQCHYTMTVIL